MRQRIVKMVFGLGLIFGVAGGAFGFDLGDIQIHGFVSQGYIDSTEYDMMTAPTEGGTFAFNEMGLNFSTEPVEDLRIGVQLYSRDLGKMGNNRLELDWAVGDYRWRDELGFRLGKVKMPFGLYNEVRDADMARPSIVLPMGIYPEVLRDLINTYTGGEVYGTFDFGGGGSLGYRAYAGTMDLDGAYVVERFMHQGAIGGMRALPIQMDHMTYELSNISAEMDDITGLMLEWATPVDGLRIRGTWHQSESRFANNTTYAGWMEQIPASITMHSETDYDTEHSCVLSTEYIGGPWRISAEYWESTTAIRTTLSGLPFALPDLPERATTNQAYYAQVAYRFSDRFQLSGYYSEYFDDKDDKDGDLLALRGLPAHGAWSETLALSARFDFNRNWLLKLEAHLVDGTALVNSLENPVQNEQDWEMFLARFTYHF